MPFKKGERGGVRELSLAELASYLNQPVYVQWPLAVGWRKLQKQGGEAYGFVRNISVKGGVQRFVVEFFGGTGSILVTPTRCRKAPPLDIPEEVLNEAGGHAQGQAPARDAGLSKTASLAESVEYWNRKGGGSVSDRRGREMVHRLATAVERRRRGQHGKGQDNMDQGVRGEARDDSHAGDGGASTTPPAPDAAGGGGHTAQDNGPADSVCSPTQGVAARPDVPVVQRPSNIEENK